MAEKVYLVDGSGYIFRAFYAVAPLSNHEGFPTNALFGFLRMLLKLLREAKGGHVVVVFDAGKETFRNALYDKYKANRAECPPDLAKQMPYFREFVQAMGLPVLELPGYEADDVIGTLVEKLKGADAEAVVVSGDKDLLQLVSADVTVWDTMKDKVYREPEVREKFGVGPEKVVEVLGLIGDDSDNIPGLNGVGPKTAVQLIEKFGSVERVLASSQEILQDASIRNRKKIAEVIESDTDTVRLSRQLVEIKRDAPVQLSVDGRLMSVDSFTGNELVRAFTWRGADRVHLNQLISRFDFASLMKEFDVVEPGESVPSDQYKYKTVLKGDFQEFLKLLQAQTSFAFDTETDSLDPLRANLVGLSFSWSDTEAFYIPVGHQSVPNQVPLKECLAALQPILSDQKVEKCGQNIKYDISVLSQQGVQIDGPLFDTMVASYVLAPDRGAHNLTVLAHEYFGHKVIEYDQVTEGLFNFSFVAIDKATQYAGQDAHFAWLLAKILRAKLKEQELLGVFSEIEMPLVPILSQIECTGIALDTKKLAVLSEEFGSQLAKMEKQIFELAGEDFNINSPKQLSEILFVRLGISSKGVKRTKTGISTDSSVLERLSLVHPLPKLILEYRSIHKLKSTYVDSLPAQVSAFSGRLHTRLNQTVTGTGRLSSSEPNLQNIPVQTVEGRKIREAFIADPNRNAVLISADYSQIELRVLAHLSGDENLISAFRQGIDIHAKTAREIMRLAPDAEITAEQRRMGKTINFGVVYGMGGFRPSRQLEIPLAVANEYIEGYFARFPRVREYFKSLEELAEKTGAVTTLFGRKRILSMIDASGRDQNFVRRAAINAPIQGTAADIMKLAMISVAQRIRKKKLPLKMLLQIHDELLFECEAGDAVNLGAEVREAMQQVTELVVPLVVDVGIGKNWQEAKS